MQSTERQRHRSVALRQINANIYFISNYRGTEAVGVAMKVNILLVDVQKQS